MSVNTLIAVNSSAGDVATSLPWAGNMSGKTYLIKKVVSAGNVTISGNFIENEGTVTLDGGATGSHSVAWAPSVGGFSPWVMPAERSFWMISTKH